jgi:hypothetical protein
MTVDVSPQQLIRVARRDVAAFMFDPTNDLRWTGGITSSRPDQPGPLARGATVQRSARFLGRSFDYRYVVTADEPERLVELQVDRPFPMAITYRLEDVADGTLVTIHASGTPGRFFGWASPLMAQQVRRSIAADLRRLRDCLEG